MNLRALSDDPKVKASLNRIVEMALGLGVQINLSHRRHYLGIQWFERVCGKKGAGAIVMEELCREADLLNLDMRLTVIGNPVLVDYYMGFGFVAYLNDPPCDEIEMIRRPK